ncbi:MAG: two-component system, OmpR family, alkaline phosphatase synthesis response regulator PhoP [Solirubrobacteraceae bacterium]|jgi:DNA-binding response OmpR family regulator|nr:two-component system, OmpR family, alkaline phosphatase synthesis response regulator PhoP [Solirubrobacteraceae bacterium]MEA2289259.1 two-component system, OmpR family, alkaline phosphatase synthesis response regulator PhoP [Solirubrobacteraceae bacterium]
MAKVLIADDQPNMRQLVRLTLESDHFEIFEAPDGDAALEIARRERPDLAFLDWTMPGTTGVEVCRALREDPATAAMRIVMLTARSQPGDRAHATEMGADDFITKPFSPIELLEKVRDVLGPEALL